MTEVYVKQGDLLPVVEGTLYFEDETGMDLTGCAAKFHMIDKDGTVKVDAAAVIIDVGPPGVVEYQWSGSDTDTPGRYRAEFEVTRPDGKTQTWPTLEPLHIIILEQYA